MDSFPNKDTKRILPRILLICQSYPPILGGSEVEAQRISTALISRGYKVEVLCGADPPMPQQSHWVDPYGVPVRIFGVGWHGKWGQRIYSLSVGWHLIKERHNYQVVYCLMQGLHLAVSLLVARILGKPLVMKISGSAVIPRMQNLWLGRLELKWLQQWAKRVMILNDGMVEEAMAAGFDPKQLLWMPNPVDTDEFCPGKDPGRSQFRARVGINGPAAIYVGRLAPEKELSSLVRGFAIAARKIPQAKLVLVGDGPCRKELDEIIATLGIQEQVLFPGRLPAAQVNQWLQACDVFTLVSSIEGFSCSLTEAMACGLPSVVSDIPGNCQLIQEGVHGLISKLKDDSSIGSCLETLFQNADLRAKMSTEARRCIVENYSTGQVADRYESLFSEVTQG